MLIFYQTAQKTGMVVSFNQPRKRIFTFRKLEANLGVLVSLACGYAALQTFWFIFPIPRFRSSNIQKL
jgi:hypothetical protein